MTAAESPTHIALNGWFWNRPDTGSGQYIRNLVTTMRRLAPGLHLTLIVPGNDDIDLPEGINVLRPKLRFGGHLGKVHFEQVIYPHLLGELKADLGHVPYWGSPLSSPVPIVVTIHDIIPLKLPEYRGSLLARLYTSLVAAAARGAVLVLTDSNASKDDIVERLVIPAEKVEAIYLAVGPDYRDRGENFVDAAIRKEYNLPAEYVLYLGGFDVRKNVRHLLKAYTYVRAGLADQVPLVIAGRLPKEITPRFDNVKQLIEQQNLSDAVRLIGYIDEGHKASLYRMARVFVYPSVYEGFGLPVLEAMASGTPVITTDLSSLPEVVGEAGFVVGAEDARGMAGAILAIINQDNIYTDLKQKGLERAKAFSWETTVHETIAMYGKALAEVQSGQTSRS